MQTLASEIPWIFKQVIQPIPLQVHDADGVDDSTYIGKATFKRNQFAHASNISRESEQTAHMKSLRRNNEDMEKMAADLDRMIKEKEEALRKSEIFIVRQVHDVFR